MSVEIDGVSWSRVVGEKPSDGLIVGGNPPQGYLSAWPHYNGLPLPYFASYEGDGLNVEVFIGSAEEESYLLEDGANAVIVNGNAPEWITLEPVDESKIYVDGMFVPDRIETEAVWLQGDETPDDFELLFQVPSQIDGGEEVNIGEGYGTAYVFVDNERNTGRVVWQS